MTDDWDAPEREVLAAVAAVLDRGEDAVLVTVVDVEGSSYRRPGAKMLVRDGGDGVGQVTAGCLEPEVGRLAEDVLATGRPRVERYDLRADDDVWGLGVGCDGAVTLLLEPVDERLRAVVEAHREGRALALATVIDGPREDAVGSRARFDPTSGDASAGAQFPGDLLDPVRDPAVGLADGGGADAVAVDGWRVFLDGLAPPEHLLVVGTGRDVAPLVEVGARAGFRVTVAGFRGAAADPERFPAADRVASTSPADLREAVDLDGRTYAVVASHNFVDDRIALEELLASPVPYVGLLGPRDRFADLRSALESAGESLGPGDRRRVYAPVGLDVGSGAPYEVAVSVIAEVLAVANGRSGGHLRDSDGPIHERVDADAE